MATPARSARRSGRERLLAVLTGTGGTFLLLGTFAASLVTGVSLHASTPAFRRLAAAIGNDVLGDLFEGKIVVRDVQSLGIGPSGTLRAREVEVLDPEGQRVILARDVEGAIELDTLLRSLAGGGGPVVVLTTAKVGDAEVRLDTDASGTPIVARTFHPRPKPEPKLPSPVPPKSRPSGPPRVTIPRAVLGHVRVRGNLVPPALDAEGKDLEAGFSLENEVAHVRLDRGEIIVHAPSASNAGVTQRAPITGTAHGSLDIVLATAEVSGSAELTGDCGGLPVVARARIDKRELEVNVDVGPSAPAAVLSVFPDLPLAADAGAASDRLEVHAHARGQLPTLGVDAVVRLGPSEARINGEIDLGPSKIFKVDVDASHVDVARLRAGVASDLSGKLHSEGSLGGGAGANGTFRLTTTQGTVKTERIPPAVVEGRFDSKTVTATVRANEPGVDLSGQASLDVPTRIATFDVQARSSDLRAVSRSPSPVGGAASARVRGTVNLGAGTIQARAEATGEGLSGPGIAAKQFSANGKLEGPLAAPVLDVGFAGVDVAIQAKGKTPLVYPHATGQARIELGASPRLANVSVNVGSKDHPEGVGASARSIHVAGGVVEAQGLEITGLGEPLLLDVRAGAGGFKVKAKSAGVDLRRAAGVTGIRQLEMLPEGTRAVLDVDIEDGPRGADGHLDIVVRSEKGFGTGPVTAEAHATATRGKVTGNAKVTADGFGQVEITSAELFVPGRIDAQSLARTTGSLELRGAIDLGQGAAMFAGESVERVSGVASFEGRVDRGQADAWPAARVTVRTSGLEVVVSDAASGGNAKPVELTGIDLLAHVAWDGRTEDAEVALVSWDRHGLLGSAGAKTKVPLAAWITGARKLDRTAIASLEVDATADLPTRPIAQLPAFLGLFGIRGKVDGRVRVSGTVERPRVVISAKVDGLREAKALRPEGASFEPLDGTLEARWDGEQAAATFALDERAVPEKRRRGEAPLRGPLAGREASAPPGGARRKPREPGHLRGLVLLAQVRMADLLGGKRPNELPWRASTEIEVENLDLAALPLQQHLNGVLTGRARVKDLNDAPSFEAKAHVTGLGAGGATVESADLTLGGRDASLFAHATIDDPASGSKATIQIASQSLRIRGIQASIDPVAPTRIDYAIQQGRLALLQPLLKNVASEIDGRVDGAGSITIERGSQSFEGGLVLHDARLYVNVLGEEVTNLGAVARFDRSGTWRIDEASGKVGAGDFRASATGQMKGLSFVGAQATVIAGKGGVPISAEGATFAEAVGEVKITARMSDARTLVLDVDIPRADVELPDRSPQQLEQLEADPTIQIGIRQKDGRLVAPSAVTKKRALKRKSNKPGKPDRPDRPDRPRKPAPAPALPQAEPEIAAAPGTAKPAVDPLVTRMTVVLGDDVHLKGRDLDVNLGGKTLVEIANEISVTGRIDLRGGTIVAHGRRFTVDRGTVTFFEDADPSDPTIVAAAYWDSPDRTRVWVEFAGPLKSGKLTLRSEPPYGKNEILSVLLFGRPDPNMGTAGGKADKTGDASGATAVGSGFVAGDLNRMLSELDENLDIETDTLSGNRTRTKLGRSFFDRRLKVQVGYAPGHTYREPDRTFLFLNWQFIPKWSLVATRGDRGTSILDVLFQHRY